MELGTCYLTYPRTFPKLLKSQIVNNSIISLSITILPVVDCPTYISFKYKLFLIPVLLASIFSFQVLTLLFFGMFSYIISTFWYVNYSLNGIPQ